AQHRAGHARCFPRDRLGPPDMGPYAAVPGAGAPAGAGPPQRPSDCACDAVRVACFRLKNGMTDMTNLGSPAERISPHIGRGRILEGLSPRIGGATFSRRHRALRILWTVCWFVF